MQQLNLKKTILLNQKKVFGVGSFKTKRQNRKRNSIGYSE